MTAPGRALLDTSVLIATESGRQIDEAALPMEAAVSAVTLAELQAGVLRARDSEARGRRMATLGRLASMKVFPIDEEVASEWARLRVHLAEHARRVNLNDLWIAASAVANRLPLVTKDDDFEPLDGVRGLIVVRV